MKDGVYIHFSLGWILMEVRTDKKGYQTFWFGKPEFSSFASAKIAAQRRAIGLELPYRGECVCKACGRIPRTLWAKLRREVTCTA